MFTEPDGLAMNQPLPSAALDQLFLQARTYGTTAQTWLPQPVSDTQLRQIWDLARMGPTSANCSPMRVVFVRTTRESRRTRYLRNGRIQNAAKRFA